MKPVSWGGGFCCVGRKKAGYLGTFYKKAVLEEVEKERQVTRICGRFLVVLHIGADLDAHQRAAQQHLIALHFDCAAPAPTLGVTAALAPEEWANCSGWRTARQVCGAGRGGCMPLRFAAL